MIWPTWAPAVLAVLVLGFGCAVAATVVRLLHEDGEREEDAR